MPKVNPSGGNIKKSQTGYLAVYHQNDATGGRPVDTEGMTVPVLISEKAFPGLTGSDLTGKDNGAHRMPGDEAFATLVAGVVANDNLHEALFCPVGLKMAA